MSSSRDGSSRRRKLSNPHSAVGIPLLVRVTLAMLLAVGLMPVATAGSANAEVVSDPAKQVKLNPGAAARVDGSTKLTDGSSVSTFSVPSLQVGTGLYAASLLRANGDDGYRAKIRVESNGRLTGFLTKKQAGGSESVFAAKVLGVTVQAGSQIQVEFAIAGTSPVDLKMRVWTTGSKPDWQLTAKDTSSQPIVSSGASAVRFYLPDSAPVAITTSVQITSTTSTTPPPVAADPPPSEPVAPFPVSDKLPSSAADTIKSTFPVPAGAIFVSPNGSNSASGTAAAPYKTLGHALTKVAKNGTVVLRAGTYREGASGHNTGGTNYVVNLSGVTIQSYPGESVWLDGTEIVGGWSRVSANNYKVAWSTPTLCAGKYYSRHYASQTSTGPCSYDDAIGGESSLGNPQMVFVDGTEIKEVNSASKLTAGTFFYDWSARTLHLGFDPTGKTVEVTKHSQALALFKPVNVRIKGIGFRRYASNQYLNATNGALLLNQGSNVLLENVAMTQNAGSGLLVWNVNKLTIRSSWVSGNGANGMNVAGSAAQKRAGNSSVRDDLTIEYSRLDRNNADSYSINCTYSCSASGVKIAGLVGGDIRYSTFSYNGGERASGFWCDLDCSDVNIYGNMAVGNARHGILYEVSSEGVIASNQVVDNGWGSSAHGGGYGIMVGSATTRIYNNTIIDNKQGVFLYDDDRSRGSKTGFDADGVGPDSVNISMVNNIIASGRSSSSVLIRVTGGKSTIATNTTAEKALGRIDHNSYAKPDSVQFINWRSNSDKATTVYSTVAALRSAKGSALEPNGGLQSGNGLMYLTSPGTGDYSVKPGSAAYRTAAAIPSDIAAMLGVSVAAGRDRGIIHLGG